MGEDNGALPKSSSNGGLLLIAENMVEKLKLCDYDVDYCHKKNITPFSKTYFTEPASNGNLQWSAFVGVVSWLMKQIGHEFSVDKYDDPNTSSNKLMLALKQLNFESDFPVSRLKQGYGEAVCQVLDFLAEKLLKKRGFKFLDPVYPETDGFEEAEVDDADLGNADIVDEAIESEEEDVLYSENVRSYSTRNLDNGESKTDGPSSYGSSAGSGAESKDNGMLVNEQSPEFQAAWQAELERVAPRLKRPLQASTNEWRSHLDQTKKHENTIQKALPDCAKQLQSLNNQLTESLDRISAKETFLANSFEHIAHEYKQIQEQLKDVSARYEGSNEVVEKLSNELATVTEALDELKGDMDSRGNSMVDTSPLQKIRKALAKLKSEIKQMELRIGVVGHSLLQSSLRNAYEARNAKKVSQIKSPSGSGFDRSPRSPVSYDMF